MIRHNSQKSCFFNNNVTTTLFSLSLSAESKIRANQCKILAFQFARNVLKTSPLSPRNVIDGAEPLREVRKQTLCVRRSQIFRKSKISLCASPLSGSHPRLSTYYSQPSTDSKHSTLNSKLSIVNYKFSIIKNVSIQK